MCKTAPTLQVWGASSHALPALPPTSAACCQQRYPLLAEFSLSSVTRGTLPGAGEHFPPPVLFLPAAVPLLPTAVQTLPAAVRPLLGPREHGPKARDSVAVSTTHVECLAATPPRQEVRRW